MRLNDKEVPKCHPETNRSPEPPERLPIGHPDRLNSLYEKYTGKDLSYWTADRRRELNDD